MKEKAKIDLPVLLIFFTRPDTFEKVFEQVRIAKPSKLFLACDGARDGHVDDIEKINACKRIADNIDWECEVYQNYAEENMGCGVRPQSAIGWALSIVDRIVILEDDCIPDQTFFPYMAELLERYKNDERIGMISGLNHFKDWDCGKYSYCFTRNGAIWGWATWRRVWQKYDYSVSLIQDEYTQKLLLQNLSGNESTKKKKIDRLQMTNRMVNAGEKISYWDFQFGFLKHTNSYLSIVPRCNLIRNIGVGVGSTHFSGVAETKWTKGSLYFMPSAEINIPLSHPPVVMCDYEYTNEVDKVFGYPNLLVKTLRRIKRILKKL